MGDNVKWLLNVSWRLWLFGVFLGPDTYGVSFGPLMVGWVRNAGKP